MLLSNKRKSKTSNRLIILCILRQSKLKEYYKIVRGDIMGILRICDRIIARTNMFGRQCGKTNLLISLLARYSLLANIVTNFKG